MNTRLKKIGWISFTIVLIISCRKEMEKAHWDTELLAPLINTSLSINNILPDSILQTTPDSSLKIVYQNDIFNLSLDTLFAIPDTILKKGYNIPLNITLQPGQVVFSNNISETTYNLKDVKLRKVIIKSGFVKYVIKSKIHEVTDFTYSIPCAKLNGVPFSINVSVPAALGNTSGIYSNTYDLSGYEFTLTGKNNNKVNTIYTSLTALISPSGSPVAVTPADSLIIENSFSDIIPYYAKGYFGQTTINIGPDQTAFTMFNKITDGTIKLKDVSFNLDIENPIGIEAKLFVDNLSSINTKKNTTVNLISPIINAYTPKTIDFATDNNGHLPIYPAYKNIVLNNSNSNIKQLIENLPDQLGYTIKIQTNPRGDINNQGDFIYSDRLLKTKLNMEIPLALAADNLTLMDTLNFNITKEGAAQHVNNGTLTLFANNGFPMDASIQLYLLNKNNAIKDSIFPSINTIYQASVDANLKVTQKKITKLALPIDSNKMNSLFDTKKILLKVKLNTASKPQYVKIYSYYSIDIKLVGDFNYTVYMK